MTEFTESVKQILGISEGINPGWDFDEFFLGPQGRVFFEARWKTTTDYHRGKEYENNQIVYARIGKRIFLDSRLKKDLPQELKEKEEFLYLERFDSSLAIPQLLRYGALTLYALECLDLQRETFLDLGSADGCLSLLAHRKGACAAFLVDSDPRMKGKLKRHLKVNNFNNANFTFIPQRIQKSLISRIPAHEIGVVVANLGPHYGNADLDAIALLEHLPSVHTYVTGGYTDPSQSNHYLARWHPRNAISALQRWGFTEYQKVFEETSSGCPRLTVIAKK